MGDDRWADSAHPRRPEDRGAGRTIAIGERTPRLTVEQRAIAALCPDLVSIAEVSAPAPSPAGVALGSPACTLGEMANERLVWSPGPPRPVTVQTLPCWIALAAASSAHGG